MNYVVSSVGSTHNVPSMVSGIVSSSVPDIVSGISDSPNTWGGENTSENKTQNFNIVLVLVTWVLVSIVLAMILSRMITVGKGR